MANDPLTASIHRAIYDGDRTGAHVTMRGIVEFDATGRARGLTGMITDKPTIPTMMRDEWPFGMKAIPLRRR